MKYLLQARFLAPLLLLATALVYWPALSGDFIFDDFPNIVTNAKVQPESLSLESLAMAAKGYDGPIDRPLATISFALDYLMGGKDPFAFKLSSLAVHLLNALLVMALALRLLQTAGASARVPATGLAALGIALAWAIHPLQVSSVAYVVQRMETLALTFVLLGLLAYLRGRCLQREAKRGWPWIVAAGVLAMAGLLSKETAILFPAYTLALELTVLGFGATQPATSRRWKWAYGAIFVAGATVFAVWVLPDYWGEGMLVGRSFDASERLLSQGRILSMYLGWMLWPAPDALVFYHDDFQVSRALFAPPATAWGFLLVGALLGSALFLRRRRPLVALGLFWFFGAHLLTSNVFNVELVFEHRNYFALLGIVLAVADQACGLFRKPSTTRLALACAALAMLAGLTLMRSATWGDPLQLAADLATRNPMSQRASNDLATLYAGLSGENAASPFYAQAMAEFERASRLPQSSPLSEQGLILLATAAGQPAQAAWWDRLTQKLRVNPLGAQERSAISNLVKQRSLGMDLDDTRLREAFVVLLERDGLPADIYVQLGNAALMQMKDQPLADQAYDRALAVSGRDPQYAIGVVTKLVSAGAVDEAQRFLARAEHQGVLDVDGLNITLEDAATPSPSAQAPVQ